MLRSHIEANPRCVAALAALARGYHAGEDADLQRQGWKHLERAQVLAPRNVELRLLEGELALQRNRPERARRAFAKAVSLEPDEARAHLLIGGLFEQAFLARRYKMSFHEDWVLSFSEFADEALAQARWHFHKAAALAQTPAPALSRLALLHFESGEPNSMLQKFRRARLLDPENPDYALFQGLGAYSKGDISAAHRSFAEALALMPEDNRALMEDRRLLHSAGSSPPVDSVMAHADQESWWHRQDPLFLTPENERLLEHYARVAYAKLRFGDPIRNLDGHLTDQGRVWIRFGPPLRRVQTPSGSPSLISRAPATVSAPDVRDNDVATDAFRPPMPERPGLPVPRRGLPFRAAREIWDYGDFRLAFADELMHGVFRFAWDGAANPDSRSIFRQLVRDVGHRSRPRLPGTRVPMQISLATFKGMNGLTRVQAFAKVQYASAGLGKGGASGEARALEAGFFIMDDSRVVADVRQGEMLASGTIRNGTDAAIFAWAPAHVAPGGYLSSLEIVSRADSTVGVNRDSLVVPDYGLPGVRMSSILAGEAGSLTSIGPPIPFIGPRSTPVDSLRLYFEVYNLELAGGDSRYTVEVESYAAAGDKSLAGGLLTLLGVGGGNPTASIRAELQGGGADEIVSFLVRLDEDPAAPVRLTVRVNDRISGQSTEGAVWLSGGAVGPEK